MMPDTETSKQLKKEIIELSYKYRLGHIASALSMVDFLETFFKEKYKPDKGDMLLLGKPYGSQAYYVTMKRNGFTPPDPQFSGLQKPSEA